VRRRGLFFLALGGAQHGGAGLCFDGAFGRGERGPVRRWAAGHFSRERWRAGTREQRRDSGLVAKDGLAAGLRERRLLRDDRDAGEFFADLGEGGPVDEDVAEIEAAADFEAGEGVRAFDVEEGDYVDDIGVLGGADQDEGFGLGVFAGEGGSWRAQKAWAPADSPVEAGDVPSAAALEAGGDGKELIPAISGTRRLVGQPGALAGLFLHLFFIGDRNGRVIILLAK
jgi:hypothetical protein